MGLTGVDFDRLVCMDPGIRNLGISEFVYDPKAAIPWRCHRAALIRNPIKKGNNLEAVWAIVNAAAIWVGSGVGLYDLAVEVPQIYRAEFQKGDQNDLIPLALIGGMFAGRVGISRTKLHQFLPREWKDGIDADVCTKRIWARLHPVEQDMISAQGIPASLLHNTLDAVGIGLKLVGRFEPKRVHPL